MPEPEIQEGTDLHNDIAEAMQEVSAKSEPAPSPEPVPEPEPAPAEVKAEPIAGDRERDEKGRFKAKQEELKLESEKPEDKPPVEKAKPAAPEAVPEAPKAEAKPPPASEYRAPQSWRPAAREEWGKIPSAAQAEIVRLENETKRVQRESSEARQGYQRFREAVSPFEAMIRSEGSEPVKAVENLLQTAYQLRTAPPHQKAAIVADIIRAYLPGQEGIQLVDNALVGGQQQAPQMPQQAFRDPRLDQLLAQIEQTKQQRVTELDSAAASALSEAEQQEFFEDVREDMADILDLAAKRGLQMDPMEAYNRAVALNPEVSRVVQQRQAAQQAASQNGPTQRARQAASSVRSTPAIGVRAPQANGTLREDLEEVVRELSGNRGV